MPTPMPSTTLLPTSLSSLWPHLRRAKNGRVSHERSCRDVLSDADLRVFDAERRVPDAQAANLSPLTRAFFIHPFLRCAALRAATRAHVRTQRSAPTQCADASSHAQPIN